MTLDELKNKYPNFPLALDEIENFIEWYEFKDHKEYATDWDDTRYYFALDAIKYLTSS
mgnify:CR=1 FL=1